MLTADKKRAFGPWLIIAILACFSVRLYDIAYYLSEPYEEAMLMFRLSGVVAPVYMISALLAGLPFATAFLADLKSNVCVPIQLRSGSRRYIRSKILCTILSGGLTLTVGTLIHILFLNLYFTHGCALSAQITVDLPFFAALQSETMYGQIIVYAAILFIQFLAGAFWALLALLFSTILSSPSLILCTPLVAYRLFDEMSGRFLPGYLSPTLLMQAESGISLQGTLFFAVAVYGILSALCAWLFALLSRRRMRSR